MENIDYYKVLGVAENADQRQIKESYHRLAFQYHPDRNHDPKSGAKMKTINEAYAILSNPAKRGDYDTMRSRFGPSAYTRFRSSYSENDIFRGSDINDIFEEMAKTFGFRGFDEIFNEVYGRSYRRFDFRKPGFFAQGYIFSRPFGDKHQVQMPEILQGKLGKATRRVLEKITGIHTPEEGSDMYDVIRLTPVEAQKGGVHPYRSGKKSAKLMIKIPPGVREGQRIRLAGIGENGKDGGKPGDLYLRVRIEKPLTKKLKGFFSGLRKGFGLQGR